MWWNFPTEVRIYDRNIIFVPFPSSIIHQIKLHLRSRCPLSRPNIPPPRISPPISRSQNPPENPILLHHAAAGPSIPVVVTPRRRLTPCRTGAPRPVPPISSGPHSHSLRPANRLCPPILLSRAPPTSSSNVIGSRSRL